MKLVSVLLNAGCPQTGETMLVDGQLPRQKLFDCQRITLTGFLKAEEAAAYSSNNFSLAADNPAPCI